MLLISEENRIHKKHEINVITKEEVIEEFSEEEWKQFLKMVEESEHEH